MAERENSRNLLKDQKKKITNQIELCWGKDDIYQFLPKPRGKVKDQYPTRIIERVKKTIACENEFLINSGLWRSLVARSSGGRKVVSSNLASPTKNE